MRQYLWKEPKLTSKSSISTTQAARTADGTGVLGATIFVWTDCSNNERLPLDQQNPAYQHDGVAAPQSVINTYIETVGEESCGPTGLGPCVITTVD